MSIKAVMSDRAGWNPAVRDEGGGWYSVASESAPGCRYQINLTQRQCSCPGSQFRSKQECKHIAAVAEYATSRQSSNAVYERQKMTAEQEEFVGKLIEGAKRLSALASRADALHFRWLPTEIETAAKTLLQAIETEKNPPFTIEADNSKPGIV
jgi:hypothetical protein